MGRPKGSKNRKTIERERAGTPRGKLKENADPRKAKAANGVGHNSQESEEARQKLHLSSHVPMLRDALEEKKEADRRVREVKAQIKKEGGSVADVLLSLQIASDAGQAIVKAQVENTLRLLRWNGLAVGTQPGLFDEPDRRPLTERAYEEGKLAGMRGDSRNPPPGAGEQDWLRGWHDGQAVNLAGLKKLEPEPEAEPGSQPGDQVLVQSGPPWDGEQQPAPVADDFADGLDDPADVVGDTGEAETTEEGTAAPRFAEDSGVPSTADPPFAVPEEEDIPAFLDRRRQQPAEAEPEVA